MNRRIGAVPETGDWRMTARELAKAVIFCLVLGTLCALLMAM